MNNLEWENEDGNFRYLIYVKTYIVNKRQNNVLRNINLEIKAGEMVAVMDRQDQ